MVKIKICHTKTEQLNIELSESDIKKALYSFLEEKHPLLKEKWYIKFGSLYVFDYVNGHNGEHKYKNIGTPPVNYLKAEFKRIQFKELFE